MISAKREFWTFLATCILSLLLLCGCGGTSQKSPVQEPIPQVDSVPIESPPVSHEYNLDDGTLEVYETSPCSIKFKKTGAEDSVEAMDTAESGQVIYAKLRNYGKNATGPDAIIEWTLKDGGYLSWVFSTHPKARVTAVISTHDQHLQIAEDKPHTVFTVTVDDVFF